VNDSYLKEIDENVLWFALEDKINIISTNIIVDYYYKYNTLKNLFSLDYYDMEKNGLEKKNIVKFKSLYNNIDFIELKKKYMSLLKQNIKFIKVIDKDYPNILKKINDAPLILFKKGVLNNYENCIAISGTRNPSIYGRLMARKIAYELSEYDYTIVSGLAHGIDEWAHCGALESDKGKTIAILAWMNPEYPAEHFDLFKDIINRGAVLSELSARPDSIIAKVKFIQRDRIISGMSNAVIAIESDIEGGTVHQVNLAFNQKKIVFALEPKDNEKAKRGFKLFVDMGAIPIKNTKDILLAFRNYKDALQKHNVNRGQQKIINKNDSG
jgi:DNA processing protein